VLHFEFLLQLNQFFPLVSTYFSLDTSDGKLEINRSRTNHFIGFVIKQTKKHFSDDHLLAFLILPIFKTITRAGSTFGNSL
jgi:hypothetical protein